MTLPYEQGVPQLLRQMVNGKIRLGAATYYHDAVKAQAEQRAYDNLLAGGQLGKNVEERGRQLVIAIDRDPDYKSALKSLQDARGDLWRLETELDILQHLRKDRELAARERMIDLAEQGRLPAVL